MPNVKDALYGAGGVVAGIVVCVLLLGGGCCSSELKREAQLSEVRVKRFVELIDTAQTERKQEQDFIRACGSMFTAIREAAGATALAE